jgi:hypothetical protein
MEERRNYKGKIEEEEKIALKAEWHTVMLFR